ncbi:vitamin K epoxide reductase family protein [Gordonia alkaliphila]|uniref:vitamin K epoxide reductase family protein n=1 Tax=Gordonia alkaliphila TaxID=1053547 RepID=UPI001FF50367|nr:vitamin K epoxide reductase family protein [Gordonia alkaliphila]MCK0438421.1 vitamin K epoxide reductase family protein [Gordonia alkaliphila]
MTTTVDADTGGDPGADPAPVAQPDASVTQKLLELRPIGAVASWVMLVCGILGIAGSAALSIERVELFKNPAYSASCNFSPVLSCTSVMKTEQAEFLNFPNPFLGLPAFAVILVTALLSLGKIALPRWYWIGQTLITAVGFVFVNYLAFQSIYRIGALCPYCMVVWTVTPIILVLSLSRALGDGPRLSLVRDASWIVLAAWYLIVIIAAGERFWYYWKTLF